MFLREKKIFCCSSLGLLFLLIILMPHGFGRTQYHFSESHNSNIFFKELLLKIELNHQDLNEITLIIQDKYGRTYVNRNDLVYWRLEIPTLIPVLYKGKAYYSLDDILGLRYQVDIPHMVLRVNAEPSVFRRHEYTVANKRLIPSPP